MSSERTFDKYRERGAYHWEWADPSSPRYAPAAEARYRLIADQVAGRGRVLDIGCGDGFLVGLVAPSVDFAVGVDPERSGVGLAAPRLGGIAGCAALVASGARLPFPDAAFDAVIMADVVEHLEEPEHTLREAARVLAADGRMVVTTPRRLPDHWWDKANHVREYESDELRELMAAHFGQVEMIHFLSLRWWGVRRRLGKIFMRWWARTLYNPFRKSSPDPHGFGHLMAVGTRPGPRTHS